MVVEPRDTVYTLDSPSGCVLGRDRSYEARFQCLVQELIIDDVSLFTDCFFTRI